MKKKYIGVFGYCESNELGFERDEVGSEYFNNMIMDKVYCDRDVKVKKVDIKKGIKLFENFMMWDEEMINESLEFGVLCEEYYKNKCGSVLFLYDKDNYECGLILVY